MNAIIVIVNLILYVGCSLTLLRYCPNPYDSKENGKQVNVTLFIIIIMGVIWAIATSCMLNHDI